MADDESCSGVSRECHVTPPVRHFVIERVPYFSSSGSVQMFVVAGFGVGGWKLTVCFFHGQARGSLSGVHMSDREGRFALFLSFAIFEPAWALGHPTRAWS